MALCQATKKDGEPCAAHAVSDGSFCYTHSPVHARERAEAHRRGGLGKQSPHAADAGLVPEKIRDLDGVLALLDHATRESLVLANGVARNRLLAALAAAYVDTLQAGEYEERLMNLERLFSQILDGLGQS